MDKILIFLIFKDFNISTNNSFDFRNLLITYFEGGYIPTTTNLINIGMIYVFYHLKINNAFFYERMINLNLNPTPEKKNWKHVTRIEPPKYVFYYGL